MGQKIDPAAQMGDDGTGVEEDTLGRSAMHFEAAGIIHRLLKSLAIGFIEHAMSAPEHFGALLLNARAELLDVASNFDLLAQRQVLDTPKDGFDDGHFAVK